MNKLLMNKVTRVSGKTGNIILKIDVASVEHKRYMQAHTQKHTHTHNICSKYTSSALLQIENEHLK